MSFYFSGTGNPKWAARIPALTEGEALDLTALT